LLHRDQLIHQLRVFMATFNFTAAAGNSIFAAIESSGPTSATGPVVGSRPVPAERLVSNPANWQDLWGGYHRVETLLDPGPPAAAQIRYHRADTGWPPFVVQVLATPGPNDDYARVFVEPGRERAWIIYQDGDDTASDAREVYSDDDGATWSAPAMAIPGGSRPAAAVGSDGTIYRCAYVGGLIQFTRQNPGDPTPVALPVPAIDETETPIEVEQDTIGLAEAHDMSATLTMSIIVLGETEVSDWRSFDDGASWERYPGAPGPPAGPALDFQVSGNSMYLGSI
jgi:hypothetical protein